MGLAEKQREMQALYKQGLEEGLTKADAAKNAQERTGLAMRTGMPIRGKEPKLRRRIGKNVTFGMYSV